ncbi:MAG TPA: 16S rRNA (guanine(527)-N(7))-methyltransferase RsmG [Bacillota bacterium]
MTGEGDPRVARLSAGAAALGVELSSGAARPLLAYLDLVYRANHDLNLTRIEPDQAVELHLLDSVAGLRCLGRLGSDAFVLDVGTGAGFPGVALAAARPRWRVQLVEAARKKAAFVERAAGAAGIGNAAVVWGRAESLARAEAFRDRFDAAVARAVAALPVALELALPFVRPGGWFVAYKGGDVDDEVARAKHALDALGGVVAAIDRYHLPWSRASRSLVAVRKVRATPAAYPRRPGVPNRRPLGR